MNVRDRFRVLASVTLVAAVASVWGGGSAGASPPQIDEEDAGPPRNPYAMIRGLPYRTSMCGTGMPGRLDAAMACEVIDRVFREHGYDLKRDQAIRRGSIAFTADGYDEASGAGYVFASGARLSDDAFISWRGSIEKRGDRDLRRRRLEIKARYVSEELAKHAEEVIATPDDAFDAALDEWRVAYDAERLSIAEIYRVLHRGPKRGEFIAIMSPYDPRYEFEWEGNREQSARERELFERLAIETDGTVQEALRDEIWKEIASEALARLERDVREYIRWARPQGMR